MPPIPPFRGTRNNHWLIVDLGFWPGFLESPKMFQGLGFLGPVPRLNPKPPNDPNQQLTISWNAKRLGVFEFLSSAAPGRSVSPNLDREAFGLDGHRVVRLVACDVPTEVIDPVWEARNICWYIYIIYIYICIRYLFLDFRYMIINYSFLIVHTDIWKKY